jgi:hypothetical protein
MPVLSESKVLSESLHDFYDRIVKELYGEPRDSVLLRVDSA